MSLHREQAIRDAAEACNTRPYDVVNGFTDDEAGDLAARYAVSQRERVLELEAALREIEFVQFYPDDGHYVCPNCKQRPHKSSCIVGSVLSSSLPAAEGERGP